jgi:hypothetical protein
MLWDTIVNHDDSEMGRVVSDRHFEWEDVKLNRCVLQCAEKDINYILEILELFLNKEFCKI